MTYLEDPEDARALDFNALTKPQRVAAGNVAFGGHGAGCAQRTLKKLVERGIIVPVERESRDRLGTFRWTQYEMPLPVHIRFCAWCETLDENWASLDPESREERA